MKKTLLYVFVAVIIIGSLTGCGKVEEKKTDIDAAFTMTCTTEKDASTGIETQNIVTYSFNKDQYATGYSVATTQKFGDKEVYKEYKKAQKETIKSSDEEDISYDLKSDDKAMTLVFTMTIKNLDKGATTEEEKNILKASAILKSNEEKSATCELNGIAENELN